MKNSYKLIFSFALLLAQVYNPMISVSSNSSDFLLINDGLNNFLATSFAVSEKAKV
jgi:hypothetical protein